MAMDGVVSDLHLIAFFAFLLSTHGATGVKFTFRNNCPETVWPETLTSSGPAFPTTGFPLPPGASLSFSGVGATWSGRVWGRYRCTATTSPGGGARFSCESGDCGSGQVACNGAGGAPPATLAEFTLGGGGGGNKDFYDVSNVDGFNLPVEIEPAAGGRCRSTSCPADINRVCPERAGGESCCSAAAAAAAVVSGEEEGRRRRGGGLQERVPGVRHGRVLLPRAVRVAGDVQAERLLRAVQGAVPAGV
ncbi:hypothetical protein BDA96_02G123000 [Sorghum bicolor]|uniref:Thaumatin-like protein n=1 Tax=Sorghum bicolor TaxID=4558 RepID=A0A921RLR1_SORBI|nr:hypothetical protein BDA96_02G123000 [Sorghum bicolor]